MLEKKKKSIYWLEQKTGVSYVSLWKLTKKTTQRSINLEVLSRIVEVLDCGVEEILVYVSEKKEKKKG
jgi:putative transcriptional regulator